MCRIVYFVQKVATTSSERLRKRKGSHDPSQVLNPRMFPHRWRSSSLLVYTLRVNVCECDWSSSLNFKTARDKERQTAWEWESSWPYMVKPHFTASSLPRGLSHSEDNASHHTTRLFSLVLKCLCMVACRVTSHLGWGRLLLLNLVRPGGFSHRV